MRKGKNKIRSKFFFVNCSLLIADFKMIYPKLKKKKNSIDAAASESDCVLGRVPHQVRGFLGQFHNMLIVGQSYANCTGCSEKVKKKNKEESL